VRNDHCLIVDEKAPNDSLEAPQSQGQNRQTHPRQSFSMGTTRGPGSGCWIGSISTRLHILARSTFG
jgi:hypothetical protein